MSATAIELHQSILLKDAIVSSTGVLEIQRSIFKDGVRRRSTRPTVRLASPTQQESGCNAPEIQHGSARVLLQQILPWMLSCGASLVATVHTNVLLLRVPLACTAQLEPIRKQAQGCPHDARLALCSREDLPNLPPLPSSLHALQKSWQHFIEHKLKEWEYCAWATGGLAAFVLVVLQIAEQDDPTSRFLSFITYAMLAPSLLINKMFPRYLDSDATRDVHYAYHLFALADTKQSSILHLDIEHLFSIPLASLCWGFLLSVVTFASVFYHDTMVSGSPDSNVPLSVWQKVGAFVVVGLISAISVLWYVLVYRGLTSLQQAVAHEQTPSASANTAVVAIVPEPAPAA